MKALARTLADYDLDLIQIIASQWEVKVLATDRKTGKYTLAVLIGPRGARIEYVLLLAVAYAVPALRWALGGASLWAWLPWLTLPFAAHVTGVVLTAEGRPLNPALRDTARLEIFFGVLLAVSLLL